mmetsp:Transcript_3855/g.5786  ORF Transcript_3855/g.5786 Transcript_3855/m.5786 type:complete len:147 (+) Transcript_3855:69-509(+)
MFFSSLRQFSSSAFHFSRPTAVVSPKAPPALGPYSQAVQLQNITNLIFVSGCLGMDNKGNFSGDSVQQQTDQALSNMNEILKASGASLKDVVKVTVLLKDLSDFDSVNEIYAKHFCYDPAPARACYEVARLPKDALIEIEAIASKF